MPPDAAFLLDLFFPCAALAAGAFLIYRGAGKLASPPGIIDGEARADAPVSSPISGARCIYSRVVLECYGGGAEPWRKIAEAESRAPFSLGKVTVQPDFADFRLNPKVTEGMVKRELGTIEQFGDSLSRTKLAGMARDALSGTPFGRRDGEEFLPEAMVDSLKAVPALGKALARNIRKRIRVSEYCIPPGSRVYVSGGSRAGDALMGALDARLVVTDESRDAAGSLQRERAVLGVIAGGLLLAVSAALFFLMLH
jgi:hypothetical protein